MDTIKYLYHYTSIEALALILKHKTMRLSSLDIVDDLEEAKTTDYGELGRFCFVSCWTDNSEESIPLWKMYTPNMCGVRIKLPIYPFKEYIINKGEYHFTESVESYINLVKIYDNNGFVINPPFKDFLIEVKYTNDKDLLFPEVYSEHKQANTVNKKLKLDALGTYKNEVWRFQREWRYKIFICPWTLNELKTSSVESHSKMFERLKSEQLPFTAFDLELDEWKLEDMEIMIGPKSNEAESVIVNSLVNTYNPKARITKSSLSIR